MNNPEKKFQLFPKVLFLIVLSLVCYWGYRSWLQEKKTISSSLSSQTRIGNPAPQKRGIGSTPIQVPSSNENSKIESSSNPKRSWEAFSKQWGPGLSPQFAPDGRFVSAVGKVGIGSQASSNFNPEDSEKAILRAKEILSSARELLGWRPSWPLENVAARSGQYSAQVFFHEAHDGIPLSPVGSIKIDLGPRGELIGFYSDYISDLTVTNQAVLSSEQAREKLSPKQEDEKIEGGGKVIWVTSRTEGRIAYQFIREGHQVVVDAESGKVLSSRDLRQY